MPLKIEGEMDEWLNLDFDAVADLEDKLAECKYFLSLATQESNRDRFRWLVSAFCGAAYSYFEISALQAYRSFEDEKTGQPIENEEALGALRRYVRVFQDAKRPNFVKTAGQHEITKKLYELRKGNTHHCPFSIMITGRGTSEDFHFGFLLGKGVPALAFCRQVMSLIHEVESELQKHF